MSPGDIYVPGGAVTVEYELCLLCYEYGRKDASGMDKLQRLVFHTYAIHADDAYHIARHRLKQKRIEVRHAVYVAPRAMLDPNKTKA